MSDQTNEPAPVPKKIQRDQRREDAVRSIKRRWSIAVLSVGRWRGEIAGAVFVAVVAIVMVIAWRDDRTDLGTLPAWVSAAGAMATSVGVVFAVSTYWRQRRSEIEDQASQARLLRIRVIRTEHPTDDELAWDLELTNRSDKSMFNVRVESFRAPPEFDGPAVWMKSIDVQDWGDQKMILSGPRESSEIEAGKSWSSVWIRDPDQDRHATRSVKQSMITLTDAAGRTWIIPDNYEPEKLSRNVRRRIRRLRV